MKIYLVDERMILVSNKNEIWKLEMSSSKFCRDNERTRCVFYGNKCMHNSYKESLYYHIVDEDLISCYKPIMPDSRLRVTMRIGKCSLFTISRFRRYNENPNNPSCIKSSYIGLRIIEFYPEMHYCYAYLRQDRYAITKILGKVGLFTICLVKKLSYEI